MKLKKLAAALGVALPLSFAALTAHAASTVMSFEDDNVDFLITIQRDANGVITGWTPKLSGNFAQGDVMLSVFEIGAHRIGNDVIVPGGNRELTGIAAVEIDSVGAPGIGSVINFKAATDVLSFFLGVNPNILGSSAVAMYMGSTIPFDLDLNFSSSPATNCFGLTDCISKATDGTLYQVDGFAGDPDEYWQAVVTNAGGSDPSLVAGISGATGVANFNAALTNTFNAAGPVVGQNIFTGAECNNAVDPNCIVGLTVTGPLTGGLGINSDSRDDGAFARSDFDGAKRLLVPEPGTLALAGLSLLGVAGIRRRLKK